MDQFPVLYLLGGVAGIVVLSAVVLITMVSCSCVHRPVFYLDDESDNGIGSYEKRKSIINSDIMEAKVVVIMPGDEHPSFLANPTSTK
ncbi:hypothetical protein SUGI_0896500 [Cryptomeria japonica]|nr:hypothetical protein SUGI_0896500 [Cryptomeria japonica]